MVDNESGTDDGVGRTATRREWIGLGVLALPCLLYSMDLTVLNLAVPHLSADLAPSGTQLLWIVDIYGFLVAGAPHYDGDAGRSDRPPPAAPHRRGIVFVRRQRTLSNPLIDLSLFRSPAFTASLLVNVLGFFVAFGTFLFIAQYLQLVLGMSPLQAGLWTAPSGLAFIAGSMLAPVLARRMSPTRVIACGFAVAAAGFAVLTQIGRSHGPSVVVSASVILSLGLAPVFTMATDVIVGLAPLERAGMAAALSETSTEFGGALGIAILGSIVTAVYRSVMASVTPLGAPSAAADAARDTLGAAAAIAASLPDRTGAALLATAREAFTDAVVLTATVSALVIVAALVTTVVLRDVRPEGVSHA